MLFLLKKHNIVLDDLAHTNVYELICLHVIRGYEYSINLVDEYSFYLSLSKCVMILLLLKFKRVRG